jgi:uncharacterized glyoxalase superfamily protein PhnB
MTDPFEALREPVTPADPDPDFAGRLRTRLTRAVLASPGGTMSQPAMSQPAASEPAAAARPARPAALTPSIVVADARRAMDWYAEVLGARPRGELHVNADGTIGHAEVGIGGAVLMFAEASGLWPDVPVRAPDAPSTFSHTLHLEVDDVDASTERARRAGAAVEREPADQPYGRGAVIVDPFGHRWMLLRPPPEATAPGPRILVIGLDPYRVPGPWDPQPVADAIEAGIARFAEHGVGVETCLLGLDGSDDVPAVVAAALRARPWACVVIGGGVRNDDQLQLFEQVLNLVRRHAPDAAIAFSSTPSDTFDAAARWVDIPGLRP